MGYFIGFLVFLNLILFSNYCQASDVKFGQYNYAPYMGLNQRLQYQRNLRARNYYNQNPTRNIILPRGAASGYYPNIDGNRKPQSYNNNSSTNRYNRSYYR